MLQNRVDPWGNIIKTSARGAWTGTRGVIHDHDKNIVRPFKLKAWITCLLEFKERKRQVMSPDRYTELFFLDEATSFAAGHRPCAECRRNDFNRFKKSWLKGNPGYGFDEKVRILEIDHILHSERINKREKQTYEDAAENLPDGSFVLYNNSPFLISGGLMYEWSAFGYSKGISIPKEKNLTILTPKSTVNAFRAGYRPQMAIDES